MKTAKNLSNEQILKGILEHDKSVVNYIYQRHFDMVLWYVKSNSGDRSSAYDVFQDALMALYVRLQNSSLEISSSFETYFIGSCKLIWLMELRRRSRKEIPTDSLEEIPLHSDTSEESYEKEKRLRVMQEAILKLPPNCQKMLALQQQGLSIGEISRIMEHKSDTYTRLKRHRCKEYLIELVKNHIDFKER